MTRREPDRLASPADARRREVERMLAEAALLPGPRALASAAAEEASFALRLRAVLERLGPVFSSFGLYLASRADLLPAGDCLDLAPPDWGEPMPTGMVLGIVAGELGRSRQEVFEAFDEQPRESRLFFQTHRAQLLDGQAVVVRVVRPGIEEQLDRDLPLLSILGPVLAEAGRPGALVEEAAAGFRAALPQTLDLAAQAEALETLAAETEGFGPLRTPRVHRGLSTPRLLVLQDLGGWTLAERLRADTAAGRDAGELARRLCLVWLRQALLGRVFPVEPWGADVTVLPDDRIAFTGGAFATPPASSQGNFWGYLIAASNYDPEEISACLLREMTPEGPPSGEEKLRLLLRQAVPFRDGGWSAGGESLAEHLFLHWRFARDCGFRPRSHLLAFWRGLAVAAATARRLDPGRDALLQAFEEVRLLASVQQIGELMSVERLRETLERYAALMVDLPQKLDDVLTLAAEGGLRRDPRSGAGPARRPQGSTAGWVAILLAMAAVLLLARQLGGVWGERTGALLFLLLGALLLRLAVRT